MRILELWFTMCYNKREFALVHGISVFTFTCTRSNFWTYLRPNARYCKLCKYMGLAKYKWLKLTSNVYLFQVMAHEQGHLCFFARCTVFGTTRTRRGQSGRDAQVCRRSLTVSARLSLRRSSVDSSPASENKWTISKTKC